MASIDGGAFRTEAFLIPPASDTLPASLVLRVENISKDEIWILNDISTIIVPSKHEDDELSQVHFDFGVDPDAQYVALSDGACIELEVLVVHDMGTILHNVMRARVPITVRSHRDGMDNIILLMFDVQERDKTSGGRGGLNNQLYE